MFKKDDQSPSQNRRNEKSKTNTQNNKGTNKFSNDLPNISENNSMMSDESNGEDAVGQETGSDRPSTSRGKQPLIRKPKKVSNDDQNEANGAQVPLNSETKEVVNVCQKDKSTNTSMIDHQQLLSSSDSDDFGLNASEEFIMVTKEFPVNYSLTKLNGGWTSSSSLTCSDMLYNRSSMPNNMNFLKQGSMFHSGGMSKHNSRTNDSNSIRFNMINSLANNSNNCRTAHHHHSHLKQITPTYSSCSERHQIAQQSNQKNETNNNFEMSSVQATQIISNHCNSENITNASSNSPAVTTLTSSSSGLPVTTLTVMESPKLLGNQIQNWQAYMPTLKDRMATIFNRDILADVKFNVGKKSQIRFSAHKFVLSIGSAVFDAMFNGLLTKTNESELKPHSNSNITEIDLPDIEPEAFQALLRFLYLDEVDIGPETVMATLYAAKKYEVLALEVACVNFLKANMSPDNAFMLLTQARLFDEAKLADLCLDAIDKHTMNALQSDSFLEIDIDTLKLVLGRDTLRVREVSLFSAVLKWTEAECTRQNLEVNGENRRKVLADGLYLLRFPLMTMEEFAENAAQSGLLTLKEVVDIFLYFTLKSKALPLFSLEPRCCITGEEYSINRFQRTESRWGYSGTSDRIRFLTDRPICVIGFGLYGSFQSPSEYDVHIEIIHTGSGKVLAFNNTSFTSDGSDSTFKVMFQYPVKISQNTNYTACATLKGIDSYYGTNGSRTLTVNLGDGTDPKDSVTFQFSYAAGCNNGTSVEDGQIPEIIFYV